eukprot:gene9605-biopygen8599
MSRQCSPAAQLPCFQKKHSLPLTTGADTDGAGPLIGGVGGGAGPTGTPAPRPVPAPSVGLLIARARIGNVNGNGVASELNQASPLSG